MEKSSVKKKMSECICENEKQNNEKDNLKTIDIYLINKFNDLPKILITIYKYKYLRCISSEELLNKTKLNLIALESTLKQVLKHRNYSSEVIDRLIKNSYIHNNLIKDSRLEFVKEHKKYFPVTSQINFDLLYDLLTNYKNKQPTIKELSHKMDIKYCTLYRAVKFLLGFRFKKCNRINNRSINKDSSLQHIYFIDNFLSFINYEYQFIFIDESGFNTNKRTSKIWTNNTINSKLLDKGRVSGINLIIACSIESIINYEFFEENIGSDHFIIFLRQLIKKISENSYLFEFYNKKRIVIIMDNCSFHKSYKTLNFIRSTNFNLLSLPSYQPQINIVEYIFSYVKKDFYSSIFSNT